MKILLELMPTEYRLINSGGSRITSKPRDFDDRKNWKFYRIFFKVRCTEGRRKKKHRTVENKFMK